MPSLVVHFRDGARRTVELSGRPVKLGRADNCDVVLAKDGEVSRVHAEVWLDEDGRVLVADMNSKNGTRVDEGEPFRNATRVAQQSIRIGEHDIEIIGHIAGAKDASTSVTFMPDAPTQQGDTRYFPSSKRLDLNEQRLTLLMSLTERIGGTFDRKQLLEHALDACCEALNFERGLIALKLPRGELELPVTRNVQRDENGAYKVSRTLINRALMHGERAVVNNPATDLVGANFSDSLVRFPISSALCVPVLNRNEILGVIYGDRLSRDTARADSYTPADVDFLAAIAQQVGVGLVNLRLLQEHLHAQRVMAELEQAREIQQRLLPSAPLRVGRLVLEGCNEPSSAVSGDYFDYFEIGDGRVGIIIADVTGHGLPAALMMANLQAAVHVALTKQTPLPDLAARINKLICRNTDSHVFITAILGTIDPHSGLIEFVSAGHPGPLLLHGQRVTTVEGENSLPLGIDPDESYRIQRVHPESRPQAVLFYTDGLIEAADDQSRLFGLPAIVRALTPLQSPTAAAVMDAARDAVRGHLGGIPNADDMTLLAIHFGT